MPPRIEAIASIQKTIQSRGYYPVDRADLRHKRLQRERDRRRAEKSRQAVLPDEYASGYRVVVLGSARLKEGTPEFDNVRSLTRTLVEARPIDIVTGGGPGIMEAANQGAQDAIDAARVAEIRLRSKNHGVTMKDLGKNEPPNRFLHFETKHDEFTTRIQHMIDISHSAYNAPGGIGTNFELVMLAQLRQMGQIEDNFVIYADHTWEPVVASWRKAMYQDRVDAGLPPFINKNDLDRLRFSRNINDAVDGVVKSYDYWWHTIGRHVRIFSSTPEVDMGQLRGPRNSHRNGNKRSTSA